MAWMDDEPKYNPQMEGGIDWSRIGRGIASALPVPRDIDEVAPWMAETKPFGDPWVGRGTITPAPNPTAKTIRDKVPGIVKDMVTPPPIAPAPQPTPQPAQPTPQPARGNGMTTRYEPGEDGFLTKVRTAEGTGIPLPPELRGGGYTVSGVTGALPVSNMGAVNELSAPKYNVPGDMRDYFDNVVRTLTGPSVETEHLKNMSQGFGLMGLSPKDAAAARIGATKALADIEGIRRNGAANLAHTLSYLMTDPAKFDLAMYGKQLDYDVGRRTADIGLRRVGVEEMKAPWEINKLRMAAPETVAGLGPGGERVTKAWNPDTRSWETLTKGALPLEAHAGGRIFDPSTGKVLAEGEEKSAFKERLGQLAFKSYEDEFKRIDDDLRYSVNDNMKPEQRKKILASKAEAQAGAWKRLQESMGRLGYRDMFGGEPAGSVTPRQPNETIEQYLNRVGR